MSLRSIYQELQFDIPVFDEKRIEEFATVLIAKSYYEALSTKELAITQFLISS